MVVREPLRKEKYGNHSKPYSQQALVAASICVLSFPLKNCSEENGRLPVAAPADWCLTMSLYIFLKKTFFVTQLYELQLLGICTMCYAKNCLLISTYLCTSYTIHQRAFK